MDWETYKKVFRTFEFSIYQSLVMTRISAQILADWPRSLPPDIREPLEEARKRFGATARDYFDKKISSEEWHTKNAELIEEWEKVEGRRPLFGAVLNMYFARPNTSTLDIDFRRIVVGQALVMILAHLDAFLADTMRAICTRRIEALKSGKRMEWSDIVAAGSWGNLIGNMIEEHVFEFGWPPIRERLKILREKIGLDLGLPAEAVDAIEAGEAIRDVIVHNGGNVSQEYLRKTKRTDIKVGAPVELDLQDVAKVGNAADEFARDLAKAVGKKFYGEKDPVYLT